VRDAGSTIGDSRARNARERESERETINSNNLLRNSRSQNDLRIRGDLEAIRWFHSPWSISQLDKYFFLSVNAVNLSILIPLFLRSSYNHKVNDSLSLSFSLSLLLWCRNSDCKRDSTFRAKAHAGNILVHSLSYFQSVN